MKMLGFEPTEHEIKTMLQVVDKDGSGEIDYNEFHELMSLQFRQRRVHKTELE
jgi:centrin-1